MVIGRPAGGQAAAARQARPERNGHADARAASPPQNGGRREDEYGCGVRGMRRSRGRQESLGRARRACAGARGVGGGGGGGLWALDATWRLCRSAAGARLAAEIPRARAALTRANRRAKHALPKSSPMQGGSAGAVLACARRMRSDTLRTAGRRRRLPAPSRRSGGLPGPAACPAPVACAPFRLSAPLSCLAARRECARGARLSACGGARARPAAGFSPAPCPAPAPAAGQGSPPVGGRRPSQCPSASGGARSEADAQRRAIEIHHGARLRPGPPPLPVGALAVAAP